MTVPRRLGSWIESFLEYTEILPSPPLLRRWAAISYVAAALERKVWVRTMGSDLYPNLYTFLVGPPGVGKGVAIAAGERLKWTDVDYDSNDLAVRTAGRWSTTAGV